MKGTPVNRIFSSAVKVSGSLAMIGAALAAAATPAAATPTPVQAYGVNATGPITINPVAVATPASTPAVSSGVVVPGFITTGGILDRATSDAAYSQVGSVKAQLYQQVDQLNATDVMSSCRTILGTTFGFTTIQGGSISTPTVRGLSPIQLPRNPAINTTINLPGITITLNMQSFSKGIRTVTAIDISKGGQDLSIGNSTCGRKRDVG
jgi:hypothetical protein